MALSEKSIKNTLEGIGIAIGIFLIPFVFMYWMCLLAKFTDWVLK